ncbi:glycosyltransferase [Bifidobacterium sp. 82T10]|uniref:Glycosyltransferase n=1 Tax=Bifidobacterium miconis TaxID=2834435 RepID=A0ABS6WHA2_9BIFI|nr:glycosyltransferase [Bifidobacterium miconis]MBW3093431.1 glycosyltransferase [Bifidobacterium miconis]
MTTISVIIPVYNQEQYISCCLDSLLNQEFKDFQLIIVNDGSTDNSQSVIETYLNDKRITFINQPNLGVSAARNCGLDLAKAEWVCFVDPDDYLEKDYLMSLYQYAMQFSDCDIICTTCNCIIKDKKVRQHFFPENFVASTQKEKIPLYIQLMDGKQYQQNAYTGIGVPWAKLYKRDFLHNNGLCFSIDQQRMQDNLFNMKAMYAAHKICYIDYAGYNYRVDSLVGRSYRKLIDGAYHSALDERDKLFHLYYFDKCPMLLTFFYEEKVNLYYSEFVACVNIFKNIFYAVECRRKELYKRLISIPYRALSIRCKFKLFLIKNKVGNLLFIFIYLVKGKIK